MERKALQGFKIGFKNPVTGNEFTGCFFGLAMMDPAELEGMIKSDVPISQALNELQIIPVQELADMAAIPEFKEFVEKLSEMIEETER